MKSGFLETNEIKDLMQFFEGEMDPSKTRNYYLDFLGRDPMLYGTGDAQSVYLRAEEVWGSRPKALDENGIKQAMNGVSIGGKTQYHRVSNYWLEQVQGKTNAIQAKKAFTVNSPTTSGKPKQEFWDRFDNSKLSIEAKVAQKGTLTAPKAALSKSTDDREIIYDNLIRRSCKFLLYDAVDQHRPVAYALDELDLTKVAYLVALGQYPLAARARWDDTAKAVVSDNEAKIPVCSSELRELFRYWDHFAEHVAFFKGFWRTKAPWEDVGQAAQWALYAKHRAQKLATSPGAAKAVGLPSRIDSCVNETDPLLAIGRYHSLQPSKLQGRGMQVHGVGAQSETVTPDIKGKGKGRQRKGID